MKLTSRVQRVVSGPNGASVYLAARCARSDELRVIAQDLEAAGWDVTSSWLSVDSAVAADGLVAGGKAEQIATMDFKDLARSNVLVSFTEGNGARGKGGRHVEFGMAIALGIRVVVVGPRENVFHCLPQVEQYDTWAEAEQAIGLAASALGARRTCEISA